jgi:2-keto-4-pentenoate hydratase
MIRAMDTSEELAQRLVDAYEEHVRILARADSGPVDAAQAYTVQDLVRRHLGFPGRPHVWKVGATSRASEPVAAPIFPTRLSISPGRFRRRGHCSVGVEAEIAVRFGCDLAPRPKPYSRDEIQAAIGSVHVALEVVDSRLHDPEYAGPYWCLADNLLNGALVLGDEISQWREREWRGLNVAILADGVVLDERVANPPLDDLFHCLPWWIAHLGGARVGDVVTTGAWSGMHPIGQAREITVAFAGLGQCHASSGVGRDWG